MALAKRLANELLKDEGHRYLVLDPRGWLQDPALIDIGQALRIKFEIVAAPSDDDLDRIRDVERGLNEREGEQIALILPSLEALEAWKTELGPGWQRTDVQPSTIFPGLDPKFAGQLSAPEVSRLLPKYGEETRPPRGERETTWLLLEEIYGVDPDRLRDAAEFFEEVYRLHILGTEPRNRWVDRVKSDLPFWEELEAEPVECLLDEQTFLAAAKAAAESGIIDLVHWKPRLGLLETDARPEPSPATGSEPAPWIPAIDASLTLSELGKVDWGGLTLSEWTETAPLLQRFGVLEQTLPQAETQHQRTLLDVGFASALDDSYSGLHQSPWHQRPVMVHHVPHYLAARWREARTALIVVDCLSLPSWHVLRHALRARDITPVSEDAIFAWVPTVTSVSRQALLSGKIPRDFGETIRRTHAEPRLWEEHWTRKGDHEAQVAFVRAADDKLDAVREYAADLDIQRLAIVLNGVDDLIHATCKARTLGWPDIHQNMATRWIDGVLLPILSTLVDEGWVVFLTSDHGAHKLSASHPRPREGVRLDDGGQRMRVYSDKEFREETTAAGQEWDHAHQLPEDYHVLVAEPTHGYGQEFGWSHGGAAWDEVLVPFVQFEGDDA